MVPFLWPIKEKTLAPSRRENHTETSVDAAEFAGAFMRYLFRGLKLPAIEASKAASGRRAWAEMEQSVFAPPGRESLSLLVQRKEPKKSRPQVRRRLRRCPRSVPCSGSRRHDVLSWRRLGGPPWPPTPCARHSARRLPGGPRVKSHSNSNSHNNSNGNDNGYSNGNHGAREPLRQAQLRNCRWQPEDRLHMAKPSILGGTGVGSGGE